MKVLGFIVWWIDEILDRIPSYEKGKWYRYGQWGCRLNLWKFWSRYYDNG